MIKTIKEWIHEVKDPNLKQRLLELVPVRHHNEKSGSLYNAISGAFFFDKTPEEGWWYNLKVEDYINNNNYSHVFGDKYLKKKQVEKPKKFKIGKKVTFLSKEKSVERRNTKKDKRNYFYGGAEQGGRSTTIKRYTRYVKEEKCWEVHIYYCDYKMLEKEFEEFWQEDETKSQHLTHGAGFDNFIVQSAKSAHYASMYGNNFYGTGMSSYYKSYLDHEGLMNTKLFVPEGHLSYKEEDIQDVLNKVTRKKKRSLDLSFKKEEQLITI